MRSMYTVMRNTMWLTGLDALSALTYRAIMSSHLPLKTIALLFGTFFIASTLEAVPYPKLATPHSTTFSKKLVKDDQENLFTKQSCRADNSIVTKALQKLSSRFIRSQLVDSLYYDLGKIDPYTRLRNPRVRIRLNHSTDSNFEIDIKHFREIEFTRNLRQGFLKFPFFSRTFSGTYFLGEHKAEAFTASIKPRTGLSSRLTYKVHYHPGGRKNLTDDEGEPPHCLLYFWPTNSVLHYTIEVPEGVIFPTIRVEK